MMVISTQTQLVERVSVDEIKRYLEKLVWFQLQCM
jgi:hypothetical protein